MAKTRDEKKKEILRYLEENTKKEKWFLLSNKELYQTFCDKEFDKEDIMEIVNKLKNENSTVSSRISFKITYPKSYKKIIKNKLRYYVETPRYLLLILGFYILVLLSLYSPFYEWLQQILGAKSGQDFFIYGMIIGLIGSYSIGFFIDKLYKYFEDKIPLLNKNKHIITPMAIIAFFSIGIAIIYSSIFNKSIEIGHIIAIITVSILGGFAYLAYNKKTSET